MNFNSIEYVIFFTIVFTIYWSLSTTKYRNAMLLFASYYFYMSWDAKLIVIIMGVTIVSYLTGRLLSCKVYSKFRRCFVVVGAGLSILVLIIFKYINFIGGALAQIFSGGVFSPLDIILPVGISFYTFQTLSYVIDIYYNKIEPEKNFIDYALFVAFFPQLVAGPIERPEHFIPQLKNRHNFSYEEGVYGAKLIALGTFKKIVIADTIAIYVDIIYDNITQFKGFSLLAATLLFTIQIYCDFSGYSDIARGSAKLLGFDLMQNFNAPYFARNCRDFWKRWHISLSSWFQDYIYIPLGGSRVKFQKILANLIITFMLSGLWHGANWTFLIWGIYHGILNVIFVIINASCNKIKEYHTVEMIGTFILVVIGWSFFRANNVSDIGYLWSNVFVGIQQPITYIMQGLMDLQINRYNVWYFLIPSLFLFIIDYFTYKGKDVLNWVGAIGKPMRYMIYVGMTYSTVIYYVYQTFILEHQSFIYFQF